MVKFLNTSIALSTMLWFFFYISFAVVTIKQVSKLLSKWWIFKIFTHHHDLVWRVRTRRNQSEEKESCKRNWENHKHNSSCRFWFVMRLNQHIKENCFYCDENIRYDLCSWRCSRKCINSFIRHRHSIIINYIFDKNKVISLKPVNPIQIVVHYRWDVGLC